MYQRPHPILRRVTTGFDWDAGNLEKCCKHGVSVSEIEEVLSSGPAVAPDLKHSFGGRSVHRRGQEFSGPPLFVAFTFRILEGRRLVRPVSARYMHQKETERYEAARSEAEDR